MSKQVERLFAYVAQKAPSGVRFLPPPRNCSKRLTFTVMSERGIISVQPHASAQDVARLLKGRNIGHLIDKLITRSEANRKAHALAKADPSFVRKTQRAWARALDCSTGLVAKLPLWQATMKKTGRGRTHKRPDVVSLTDQALAVIPCCDNDPAQMVETDEIMRRLIEDATPTERARLNNLTPEQRRELVEIVANDPDRERSPLDDTPFKRVGRRKLL